MRWRAPLGVSLLFLAVFVGWAAWARPRLEDRASPWIAAILSRASGQPVSVGVVQIHPLLLNASVDDVRVGFPDAPFFSCRRWTVQTVFSSEPMPFSILFFGPGRSRVEKPVWRGPPLRPPAASGGAIDWRSLPFHRVSWMEGDFEISFGPDHPTLRLTAVDGELGLSPHGGSLKARGRGDPGPWRAELNVADSLRSTPLLSGRGRLMVDDLDLSLADSWVPARAGSFTGRVAADLSLAVQDFSPAAVPGRPRWGRLSPRGEIRLKDCRWRPQESTPRDWGIPLSGRLSFEKSRLHFQDTEVLNGVRVAGTVDGFSKSAPLDLVVTARGWGLENLRRSGAAGFRSLPPGGRVEGEFRIGGTVERPDWNWRATLAGVGFPGLVLPTVEATGTWRNNWFSVRATGLSGVVEAAGTLAVLGTTTTETRLWAVKAEGLSLAEVAEVNGWSRVRGRLDGALSLMKPTPGTQERARAEGRLRIEGFEWGLHRETAPVEGRLVLDESGFRVTGAKGGLRLRAERTDADWRIESLDYRAGDLHLWGAGFLSDAEGLMGLRGGIEGLAATDFPPIGSRFPEAQGTFSADGQWTGRWDAPVFDGSIRLDDFRWRPGGSSHRLRADLHGDARSFRVDRLEFDAALTARGEWSAGRGRWTARLTPTPLGSLLDFQKEPWPFDGVLAGELDVATGSRPGWEGTARLDWRGGGESPGRVTAASASLVLAGDTVTLESLEAVQSAGGRLTARATAVREREAGGGRPTGWRGSLSGEADGVTVGENRLSARWTAMGAHAFRTDQSSWTIVSPGIRWGPLDLGALSAHGRRSSEGWGFDEVRSSRGGMASFFVEGASRTLRGHWRAAGVDLAALWPGAAFPSGLRRRELDSEGVWGGTWDRPTASGRVNLGVAWREISARGEGRFEWANDRWTFPTFTARLDEGGAVTVSGTVGPRPTAPAGGGSQRPLQWEARVEGLRGEGVYRSFSLPSGWRTALSGAATGTGTWGDARVVGRFTAEGSTPAGENWSGVAAVRFASRTWVFEDTQLHTSEGRWSLANGARAVRRGGGWDVDAVQQFRNIRLGPLRFFGDLRVDGRWEPGAVSARLVAQPLWVNQRRYEQSLTRVAWRPGEIRFSAVTGDPTTLEGTLRIDRWPRVEMDNIVLRDRGQRRFGITGVWGPEEWDFRLDAVDIGAETLLSLANTDWPVTGFWSVRVRGQGSAAAPDVSAEIEGREGRVGVWPYDRLEAAAQWRGDVVEVRRLRLSRRNGYLLTGEGRLPVREVEGASVRPTLRLSLTNGRLQMLPDVWAPCVWAKGSFSGGLDIGTDPDGAPRAVGVLDIRDGRLAARAYTPRVNDLNARIVLKDDRLWWESATARVGRGTVELAGSVGLAGFGPADYDLRLRTLGDRGVRVEVPQLSVRPGPLLSRWTSIADKIKGVSQGEPRVDLRLVGPPGDHRVTGDVYLERTQFTFPPSEKTRPMRGPRWWRELWRGAEWDVVFHAGKNTWYGNEYIDAALTGDLRLAGRRKAWRASGKVETKEGAIRYLGQSFNVTRGVFEMITDTRPGVGFGTSIPYVSGQAEKTVTNLDARGFAVNDTVTMVVDRAPLGEIQPRFVSRNNPDMKTERVAMRALGLSGDQQITPDERDQLLRAGLVQLLGASASPLALRLAKNFGIDMITTIYEPPETPETPGGSTPSRTEDRPARTGDLVDYLRGAGAAARIRVTDRLFGVYKVKWDEAQNQFFFRDEIELVYRVMGSLYARAGTELDSERLLGQPPERRVALENQWRFGFPRRKKQNSEDKK